MVPFLNRHIVQFWETDAMGVVHHSNYLKFFEEARELWMRDRDFTKMHYPQSDGVFAVIETSVRHKASLRYGDIAEVLTQVRVRGVRVEFWYKVRVAGASSWVATGRTLHVLLNSEMKPRRLPDSFLVAMEAEPWTETWP